jgi:hypothetical protein
VVISVEAALVDNAIVLDYSTSEVAHEQCAIRSTDQNIPIDNNGTHDEPQFGMPGGSGKYYDEGAESNERDAMPTASRRQWAMTEVEMFDLGSRDVDG